MTGLQQFLLLFGGLGTIIGAYAAARVAGKSTVKAAKVSADEGAFVRATEIYEAGSTENDKRMARLAKDLQVAMERVERLEETALSQSEEIRTLRRSVAIYEGRVMQLEATLTAHQILVPPWNLLPADADLFGTRTAMDVNKPPRTEP